MKSFLLSANILEVGAQGSGVNSACQARIWEFSPVSNVHPMRLVAGPIARRPSLSGNGGSRGMMGSTQPEVSVSARVSDDYGTDTQSGDRRSPGLKVDGHSTASG